MKVPRPNEQDLTRFTVETRNEGKFSKNRGDALGEGGCDGNGITGQEENTNFPVTAC